MLDMTVLDLVFCYYAIGLVFCGWCFYVVKKENPDFLDSTPRWLNIIAYLFTSAIWVVLLPDFVADLKNLISKKMPD